MAATVLGRWFESMEVLGINKWLYARWSSHFVSVVKTRSNVARGGEERISENRAKEIYFVEDA